MGQSNAYKKGFIPYALAAFLIGIVGGFSTVLGPAFVQDIGIAYNNTTWTALAQAMSTAACAPILGKVGILDTVLGLQAHPFDIVLCRHGMRHGAYGDMDGIAIYLIHRGMLFPGSLGCAGNQLLHLLAAAVDGHTLVPDHGNDVAAMLANQKCLFHTFPPHTKVCPKKNR